MRLLIVEDDDKTARALQAGLQSEGFSVVLAHTGEEGFFLLSSERFDLMERLAFSLLPRGPLRRRLLGVVDRTFARMHRQSCNKNTPL
jgi:DNA-binding NtrC family response regulator